MLQRGLLRAVMLSGVALAFVPQVRAQTASGQGQLQAQGLDESASADMERAARALFQAGSVAFDQGRYDDALRHFSEAYKLAPERYLLLYNIASSYDRLRRDREALDYFERYLEAETNPVNRPAVLARVKLLREAVARADRAAEEKRVAEERAAEEAARTEKANESKPDKQASSAGETKDRPGLSPYYTYAGAGLTLAAAGAGVAMFMLAKKDLDAYEGFAGAEPLAENFREAESLRDSGESKNVLALAMFGVAGAAAVATAVVGGLLTDWKGSADADERPAASVWFGPGGAGVGYRHAF